MKELRHELNEIRTGKEMWWNEAENMSNVSRIMIAIVIVTEKPRKSYTGLVPWSL